VIGLAGGWVCGGSILKLAPQCSGFGEDLRARVDWHGEARYEGFMESFGFFSLQLPQSSPEGFDSLIEASVGCGPAPQGKICNLIIESSDFILRL
jgi:hypothetical protein